MHMLHANAALALTDLITLLICNLTHCETVNRMLTQVPACQPHLRWHVAEGAHCKQTQHAAHSSREASAALRRASPKNFYVQRDDRFKFELQSVLCAHLFSVML